MDDRLILYQQKEIRDLKAQRDQAQLDAEEWRHRAEAIHQEYMELRDQIRRGDFIKARRLRLEKG